jgi:hypothetical protein
MNPNTKSLLVVALPVVVLFAASLFPRYCLAAVDGMPSVQVTDPVYFFAVSIPADWQVTRANDPKSFWRASAVSPTGNASVAFYAFHEPAEIELEKLAESDSEIFKDLGPVTDARKIRKYVFFTKAIEKTYGKNNKGFYECIRFMSSGTYAYVLLAIGNSPDFSIAKSVFDTFDVKVPWLANLKNIYTVEGLSYWVVGLGVGLIFFGILYLLGKTGQLVRKGIGRWKIRGQKKKAALFICAPLLILGCVYSYLAVELPLEWGAIALFVVLLIAPLLGYFGIFFEIEEISPPGL